MKMKKETQKEERNCKTLKKETQLGLTSQSDGSRLSTNCNGKIARRLFSQKAQIILHMICFYFLF